MSFGNNSYVTSHRSKCRKVAAATEMDCQSNYKFQVASFVLSHLFLIVQN